MHFNEGVYGSTREGDEEGSKGLPICINSSTFILMFVPFEISREILK
jgi:hypothetical protein